MNVELAILVIAVLCITGLWVIAKILVKNNPVPKGYRTGTKAHETNIDAEGK